MVNTNIKSFVLATKVRSCYNTDRMFGTVVLETVCVFRRQHYRP